MSLYIRESFLASSTLWFCKANPSIPPVVFSLSVHVANLTRRTYIALQIYFIPEHFLASQSSSVEPNFLLPLTPSIISTLSQLANVYLVIATLYVMVCHIATDPKVVKGFFVLVALADVGHIFSIYMGMGGWKGGFGDLGNWGGAEWVNVGGALFMMINKVGTFMGWFGEIGWETRGKQRGVEKNE